MGKSKDIAWVQVDIDPKNESVVCCKHYKAKLLIGSGSDATFVWTKQYFFPQKEVVKSIGNPAGIGKGTGFELRERDRDGIGLGHYRLRAS